MNVAAFAISGYWMLAQAGRPLQETIEAADLPAADDAARRDGNNSPIGSAYEQTAADKTKSTTDGMLRDLAEVNIGDPVVHSAHGIGRYVGLVNMDLGEGKPYNRNIQGSGAVTLPGNGANNLYSFLINDPNNRNPTQDITKIRYSL